MREIWRCWLIADMMETWRLLIADMMESFWQFSTVQLLSNEVFLSKL